MRYQRVHVLNPNCLVLRVSTRLTTKKCVSYTWDFRGEVYPRFIYRLFHGLKRLAKEIYLSSNEKERIYEIMIDTEIESMEKLIRWENHIPFIAEILHNVFDSKGTLQELRRYMKKRKKKLPQKNK